MAFIQIYKAFPHFYETSLNFTKRKEKRELFLVLYFTLLIAYIHLTLEIIGNEKFIFFYYH